MFKNIVSFCILTLFFTNIANAQLSPGTLYKGHSKLEGLSNCTECHEFGKKVSNEKCLKCHKEIQTLMSRKRGYHNSNEVRKKDCAECHSDHHGLNFQIIRFDEEKFDHNLSGYKLKGEHKRIDCRECHKPDYIADSDLRKDKDTYLGMGTDCLSCHDDYHKGDLSEDCIKCHNYNKFTEVDKFDHDKSDYPLKGKHKDVDCEKCHKIEGKGDNKYQKFKNIAFKKCTDCHDDVHNGSLGTKCNSCHTEYSFGIKTVSKRFNHNKRTDYKLKGKHKRVACFVCHSPDLPKAKIFNDFKRFDDFDCDRCHDDEHEGRFGTDCSSCHTETTFNKIKSTDKFNHNITNYPLIGKHQKVNCKKCHKTKLLDPVAHDKCTDCHEDFHKGELTIDDKVTDCKECHNEMGFEDFNFDIDRHKNTNFPLKESHEATPCFACHQKDNQKEWKFKSLGTKCVDCHQDIHKGELDIKYYNNQECNNCHTESLWSKIDTFDHSKTGFDLEGKHLSIECSSCHKKISEDIPVKFKNVAKSCDKCHDDQHHGQFVRDNFTDCGKCHTPDNWDASRFDHNNARFKLDGAHKNVSCNECHKKNKKKDYIVYKNGKLECIDCHK